MANEYVLKNDGRFIRRPFEISAAGETEVSMDGAILASLNLNLSRKVRSIFAPPAGLECGPVSLCSVDDKGSVYLSARLKSLALRATVTTADGYVIPTWKAEGDTVPLQWTPPADMALMLCLMLKPTGSRGYVCPMTHGAYLFALQLNTKSSYQLPLPNLFTDCRLCTGGIEYTGGTIENCFYSTLADIRSSPWSNHLIHDKKDDGRDDFANSQALFRFRANGAGFDTIIPAQPWPKLSRVVGSAILEHLVL